MESARTDRQNGVRRPCNADADAALARGRATETRRGTIAAARDWLFEASGFAEVLIKEMRVAEQHRHDAGAKLENSNVVVGPGDRLAKSVRPGDLSAMIIDEVNKRYAHRP